MLIFSSWCASFHQVGRNGTIVGGAFGVDALLVAWEGLRGSNPATLNVDCGSVPWEATNVGSLKWVPCDHL